MSEIHSRAGRPGSHAAPAYLFVFGLAWAGAGVVELTTMRYGLHVAAGIVCLGIALLWLRGALVSLLRSRGVPVPFAGSAPRSVARPEPPKR